MPSSAHRSPRRETLARGSAARLVSWRHTCPQPVHRYRRTVTSSVVGRQPSGSCASRRRTVSRGVPWQPQRRHHWSASTTRHANTARSGSSRCPSTSRPSSSSRQNVVRSGQVKVASGKSRSSGWVAREPPSSEGLDPYPDTDARLTSTPSSAKSRFGALRGRQSPPLCPIPGRSEIGTPNGSAPLWRASGAAQDELERAVAGAPLDGASVRAVAELGLSPNTVQKYGPAHGWPTEENRLRFNESRWDRYGREDEGERSGT